MNCSAGATCRSKRHCGSGGSRDRPSRVRLSPQDPEPLRSWATRQPQNEIRRLWHAAVLPNPTMVPFTIPLRRRRGEALLLVLVASRSIELIGRVRISIGLFLCLFVNAGFEVVVMFAHSLTRRLPTVSPTCGRFLGIREDDRALVLGQFFRNFHATSREVAGFESRRPRQLSCSTETS